MFKKRPGLFRWWFFEFFYKKPYHFDKIAHSTRHLADLQYQLHNDEESEKNYTIAIGIYRREQDTNPGNLANALRGYGILLERFKKVDEAIKV